MARVLRVWQRFEVEDGQGNVISLGRSLHDLPLQLTTAANDVHKQTHTVAAGDPVKLFDVAEDLSSFSVLLVVADQDGQVQYVNNSAAQFFTLETRANLIQPVFGDAGEYGGSVGAFDGTPDDIERVYWHNDGSESANCTVLAIK